jgi:hypothetical protein
MMELIMTLLRGATVLAIVTGIIALLFGYSSLFLWSVLIFCVGLLVTYWWGKRKTKGEQK